MDRTSPMGLPPCSLWPWHSWFQCHWLSEGNTKQGEKLLPGSPPTSREESWTLRTWYISDDQDWLLCSGLAHPSHLLAWLSNSGTFSLSLHLICFYFGLHLDFTYCCSNPLNLGSILLGWVLRSFWHIDSASVHLQPYLPNCCLCTEQTDLLLETWMKHSMHMHNFVLQKSCFARFSSRFFSQEVFLTYDPDLSLWTTLYILLSSSVVLRVGLIKH